MAQPHHHIIRSHPGRAGSCFHFPIRWLIWNIKYQYGRVHSSLLRQNNTPPKKNSTKKRVQNSPTYCSNKLRGKKQKQTKSKDVSFSEFLKLFYKMWTKSFPSCDRCDVKFLPRHSSNYSWGPSLVTQPSAAPQLLKGLPCTISICPLTCALYRVQ